MKIASLVSILAALVVSLGAVYAASSSAEGTTPADCCECADACCDDCDGNCETCDDCCGICDDCQGSDSFDPGSCDGTADECCVDGAKGGCCQASPTVAVSAKAATPGCCESGGSGCCSK